MDPHTSNNVAGTSGTLLEAARTGDMNAFASLFEPFRSSAHAVAVRMVGYADADDIVMDAYLKAWKALPRFSGHSSLKTWLYRIVHNCALDFLRARKKRESVFVPLEEGLEFNLARAESDPGDPAAEAAGKDLADVVTTGLNALSAEHRATLMLRYAEGLSYSELAAATGVSIGTVMSRLFNAKRRLKKALEGRL